ncbi:MAG: antibiotic biosynthesis monooxygenase [Desulfarculus sp.]|nr:antibiotic biosynthesis monooxygenase [Desulfarculus sp.]
MSGNGYAVTMEFLARPGQEDALIQACRELAPLCRAQPGCLAWLPLRDRQEPRRFVLYMRWQDEAAYQAYLGSSHIQDFQERLAPWLLQGPPLTRAFKVLA